MMTDKPDLPTLPPRFEGETNITRHLIQQFAWEAADEREAWARADERRTVLELAAQLVASMHHDCSLRQAANAIRAFIDKENHE